MRAADTCISLESKYALTASFADIILPVATHWEGNDDEEWGELCWPSPFGDGNGQKQRKDALVAWRPLVKPMYEAREEKRICLSLIHISHGVQALLGGASGTEMQLCGFSIHRFLHMGSRQILAAILTGHTQPHPFSITLRRPAFVSSLPPAVYPVVQPVYPGTLCPTGPPP